MEIVLELNFDSKCPRIDELKQDLLQTGFMTAIRTVLLKHNMFN